MNWKQEARKELRELSAKRIAEQNLSEELTALTTELTATTHGMQEVHVHIGSSRRDERQLTLMVRKENIEKALTAVRRSLTHTERALSALTEQERQILTGFFIHPHKNGADDLMEQLHMERSTLYRHRDNALKAYTLARYGTF